MRTLTCGTLFSGGGGADLGLQAAGFTPVWAIEHDPEIAEVYRANLGNHIITAGVEAVDPLRLEPVDLLWASPPCQAHSVARSKTLAPRSDAEIGVDVLRYVSILAPRVVMIENVPPYKDSKACKALIAGLFQLGYFVHLENVNAADLGVPQTRRRLIIRAVRGGLVPPLPVPVAWVGWYAAIEDLLPSLPESKFAEWQLKRLNDLNGTTLVDLYNATRMFTTRAKDEPAYTITATAYYRPITYPKAFPMRDDNAQQEWGKQYRAAGEPATTVSQSSGGKAFLMNKSKDKHGDGVRYEYEPAHTITVSQNGVRAWLEQGRVVQMTPRALARFQSFPDSYELPEKKALACKVIGNAVPSLLTERLAAGFMHDELEAIS